MVLKLFLIKPYCLSFLLFVSLLLSLPAQAQEDPTRFGVDTNDVSNTNSRLPTFNLYGANEEGLDYREEMRNFVEQIAREGRGYKRDFIIMIKNGPELLTQVVDIDFLLTAPSTGFLRTLDGILIESPSFGLPKKDQPREEKELEALMADIQIAHDNNLTVFSLDYASDPKNITQAYDFARKNTMIPYVAPDRGFRNNRLANTPARPLNENAHTVSNIFKVKNYVLIDNPAGFGSAGEYAMAMHNTNYDMIVTNIFHRRNTVLGPQNVRTMQYKKAGARRPVLAYMDIGHAYRDSFYWQDSWGEGNPSWVLERAKGATDKYRVEFWHPSWQQVIFGNNLSFLYGIFKEGYDGVLLEGVEAYKPFENPDF